MKTGFLQLVSFMPQQIVPADVAPPPEAVAAISVGILITLGLVVAVIVIVSVLVIRAIKKRNTPKDNA